MKTYLLKTEQGIALEIDGVVSDKELELTDVIDGCIDIFGISVLPFCEAKIEELLIDRFPNDKSYSESYIMGYKRGFGQAKELLAHINKEKLFTRDDMLKAIEFGTNEPYFYGTKHGWNSLIEELLSSLRPDRVECTVETMYENGDAIFGELIPKITDGKIKVLTLVT